MGRRPWENWEGEERSDTLQVQFSRGTGKEGHRYRVSQLPWRRWGQSVR